jgi:hypothetical protein
MFKKTKWEEWYDSQPDHIKRWMDQDNPIWYDKDMYKAFGTGIIIGIVIGLCM